MPEVCQSHVRTQTLMSPFCVGSCQERGPGVRGVADPKCRCPGEGRPRWMTQTPRGALPGPPAAHARRRPAPGRPRRTADAAGSASPPSSSCPRRRGTGSRRGRGVPLRPSPPPVWCPDTQYRRVPRRPSGAASDLRDPAAAGGPAAAGAGQRASAPACSRPIGRGMSADDHRRGMPPAPLHRWSYLLQSSDCSETLRPWTF
jgi:hypothetical protein